MDHGTIVHTSVRMKPTSALLLKPSVVCVYPAPRTTNAYSPVGKSLLSSSLTVQKKLTALDSVSYARKYVPDSVRD